MKREIKGVIFDLGGVVVSNTYITTLYRNARRTLRLAHIPMHQLKEAIRANIGALERGEVTSVQFWHQICRKFEVCPPQERVLRKLWAEPYRKHFRINKATLAVAAELHKDYPLAIISNTIDEHVKVLRKQKKMLGHFDVVLFSNEVGFRKPEKGIFLLAAQKMKLPAQNLLFIDDDIRWVKAARAVGIRAIQFTSARQLKMQLKRL